MSSHIQLMLVDDSEADRELTSIALRQMKFANDILMAEDGEEALELLADPNVPTPDVILLDLNMPGMDGREFLQVVKADPRFQTIPVLVFTSSAAEQDIEAAYRGFCSGYIQKPVDLDGLIKVVRAIDDYWFAIVKRPGQESQG